jgi:hypothetical protein
MPQFYPGADQTTANPMELSAELGMFGIIAVTDEHTPRVDREMYLFFHDLYGDDIPELSQDFDCFNGRAYIGNTPVFTARVGERVRWRIAALGKEFHVFHLHGHRWFNGQIDTDSQILGPSTTLTVEYTEDNPGEWLYHCHVTDHMQGGTDGEEQALLPGRPDDCCCDALRGLGRSGPSRSTVLRPDGVGSVLEARLRQRSGGCSCPRRCDGPQLSWS